MAYKFLIIAVLTAFSTPILADCDFDLLGTWRQTQSKLHIEDKWKDASGPRWTFKSDGTMTDMNDNAYAYHCKGSTITVGTITPTKFFILSHKRSTMQWMVNDGKAGFAAFKKR